MLIGEVRSQLGSVAVATDGSYTHTSVKKLDAFVCVCMPAAQPISLRRRAYVVVCALVFRQGHSDHAQRRWAEDRNLVDGCAPLRITVIATSNEHSAILQHTRLRIHIDTRNHVRNAGSGAKSRQQSTKSIQNSSSGSQAHCTTEA